MIESEENYETDQRIKDLVANKEASPGHTEGKMPVIDAEKQMVDSIRMRERLAECREDKLAGNPRDILWQKREERYGKTGIEYAIEAQMHNLRN